jgi:hypothetical protein
MIDKNTHSVLFEFQKNLENLSSAKEQVDFFREKSLEITEGISDVQIKYVEHLQGIKLDYESRLDDLKIELTLFLSKYQNENKQTINKIASNSEEIIGKGIEKFVVISNKVEASNDEKIEAINNLLKNYKNVIESSNSLIETLNAIDFPTKLDALSSKSQLIIESINGAKQALEIKLNETENSVIDKTTTSKEQIIQNNDSKINSLTEKIVESNIALKSMITYNYDERKNQTKSAFENLQIIIEKQFNQNNEKLTLQNKEIKTLKTTLFVAIGISIIGIILSFIMR